MQKATISFIMSVCLSACLPACLSIHMEQLGSHWMDCYETWCSSIFKKSVKKTQVSLKSEKNNGYIARWQIYIYYNILLNSTQNEKCFSQICRENQNIRFTFSDFFPKLCCLWDNVEKYCTARQATDDNTKRRMHTAGWIPKATNTHSEYVIFTAFPRQQWMHKCASTLCYI